MKEKSYLIGLNNEQNNAVAYSGKRLLILAGAGSGKTRVIVHRVAHFIEALRIPSYRILAVTFTNKAAEEMRERLAVLVGPDSDSMITKTFHALGAWILRRFGDSLGIPSGFTIYDDEDSASVIRSVVGCPAPVSRKYAHCIARAKDRMLTPDDNLETISYDPEFPGIYTAYEERIRSIGNVDFGDLIMLCVRLLNENTEVRDRLRNRFKAILVDEYQDANSAQFHLLSLLAGEETYLTVVGDEDQSIYGFRGAEVENILQFPQVFQDVHTTRLETNYRSTESILNLANSIINNNVNRLGKTLRTDNPAGLLPQFYYFQDQEEEARFCASVATASPEKETAILYRTNVQSRAIESAMIERNIPYKIIGSLSFFNREEVKDLFSYLAFLRNPKDEVAFARIVNKPKRGIGAKALDEIISAAGDDFVEKLKSARITGKADGGRNKLLHLIFESKNKLPGCTIPEIIEYIVIESGLKNLYEERDQMELTERMAHLEEFAYLARNYDTGEEELSRFLESIVLDSSLVEDDEKKAEAKVFLITIHNTKGLEFDQVITTGLEAGIFPSVNTFETPEKVEEERRLFYVAVTRARENLMLTACRTRLRYGKIDTYPLSPFLEEIPKSLMAPESSSLHLFADNTEEKEKNAEIYAVGRRVDHLDYGLGYIVKTHNKNNILTLFIRLDSGRTVVVQPEFSGGILDLL